jgi:hypothetical protein
LWIEVEEVLHGTEVLHVFHVGCNPSRETALSAVIEKAFSLFLHFGDVTKVDPRGLQLNRACVSITILT